MTPRPTADLEMLFGSIAKQAIDGIEGGRPDRVDAALEALLKSIEVALDTLKSAGVTFTADAADQVLGFEWQALDQPFTQFQRILAAATRSYDGKVVSTIAYWPIRAMRLALSHRDFLVFNNAARVYPHMHWLAESSNEPARTILRDRAWRHPKEFGAFVLQRDFEDPASDLSSDYPRYVSRLLESIATVAKQAADGGDLDYFRTVFRGYRQTLDIDMASRRLGLVGDPREFQLSASSDVRVSSLEVAADQRDAIAFALGAWVLDGAVRGAIPTSVALAMFDDVASLFTDFRELWRAYQVALIHSSDSRLIFSRWKMELMPEGEVVWANDELLVSRMLVLTTVAKLPAKVTWAYQGPSAQAIWVKGLIEDAIKDINSRADFWNALTTEGARGAREADLVSFVEVSVGREERELRERVMNQRLSAAKLADFTADFLGTWVEEGALRRLIEQSQRLEYSDSVPEERFGVYVYTPKGMLVEDTGYVHWPDSGGRNMALAFVEGEDQRVIASLAAANRQPIALPVDQVLRVVAELVSDLTLGGTSADTIVVTGGSRVILEFEHASDFLPEWRDPSAFKFGSHFEGTFRGLPVYWIPRSGASVVAIMKLSHVGKLIQFVPEGSVFRHFSIKEFTLEDAEAIADGDRSTVPESVKPNSKSDVVDYLRENVLITIDESFEFVVEDTSAYRLIDVIPDDGG